MKEVIAVFDIGKTNKKVLLFDETLQLVLQEEQKFEEIMDEDGCSCDDIVKIEKWMFETVRRITNERFYQIKAINFSTYGASLVYIDDKGLRLGPVYNYLKPMPEDVLVNFYEQYGGVEEFSRNTASPALGMLNSGLQILWLKRKKTSVFEQFKTILHFPQYLSFCFTGKYASEYTSIGCHTAMWDFDKKKYHPWLEKENIFLPTPVSNSMTFPYELENQSITVGIGIHDSSASLAPYLAASNEKFILISTGTWCIFMNPFNNEPLTAEQLKKDALCYMSVHERQVKSSRLFLGHIHEVNVKRLTDHFKISDCAYKEVKVNEELLRQLLSPKKHKSVFFENGVPAGYTNESIDLTQFKSFDIAYHQLMIDLTFLAVEALNLIVPEEDETEVLYISGGFARNELFIQLLATAFPKKKVYTSEVDNATALGAALVIHSATYEKAIQNINLGLKECFPYKIKGFPVYVP